MMDIEQITCTKSKYHALVVLLQLVIELGRNKRRKLSLRKRVVLIESLAVGRLATCNSDNGKGDVGIAKYVLTFD
jgi:hypothetical protein